jgi:hypothetical protein
MGNEHWLEIDLREDLKMFDVKLECGDLNEIDAMLYISPDLKQWHLFGLFPLPDSHKSEVVTLTELVRDSVVDDLLKEALG